MVAVLSALLAAAALPACESSPDRATSESDPNSSADRNQQSSSPTDQSSSDEPDSGDGRDRRDDRLQMVRNQVEGRGLENTDVLNAMRRVPRHAYVPDRFDHRAYADSPLPIGHDQTISQPYIVAVMTDALDLATDHRVLEIGTGSGYQAAILGELADQVYTIEIVCDLADRARRTLEDQGYDNIEVQCGDGYAGWPDQAPFDRIIVTAAPPEIPEALVEQLAVGGRMVLPVGEEIQELKVVRKKEDGELERVKLMDVRFVPMVHGDAGE